MDEAITKAFEWKIRTLMDRINVVEDRLLALENAPKKRTRGWADDIEWPSQPGQTLNIPHEVASSDAVSHHVSYHFPGQFACIWHGSFTTVVRLEVPRVREGKGKPRGRQVAAARAKV